jgi:outer membrane protein OmpA-like peptidoglycan-associated protein
MHKAIIQILIGLLSLTALSCIVSNALAADESQEIVTLQRQAANMSFEPHDPNNYHLAKVRIWLDLATDEYYDKDDSGIVPAAIAQAASLLDALEKKQTAISMDTPTQITGSEKVRPDLWDKIAVLKRQDKFSCGQIPAAEAEVYLVWAGHEKYEEGWSQAAPYLRGAESRINTAQLAIKNCPRVAPPAKENITMSTDILFAFDKSTLELPAKSHLDQMAKRIMTMETLEKVTLVGHADRLHYDGDMKHNQLLSVQRAESARRYLIRKGVPDDKIHSSGVGSAQPIVECPDTMGWHNLVSCLQPNRRVDITLRGTN